VKPWINEDILKNWTEAQKRLWDSLCAAIPFQPPAGIEVWRETYLKNLTAWETVVRQTLAQEASWVQQWVERAAQEKGTPKLMAAWVRQMEEVLQRWVQTQNRWWDEYFAVLRRGGSAHAEQSEARSAQAITEAATESASAAAEPPIAPPEPVVEVVEPAATVSETVSEAVAEPVVEPAATVPETASEAVAEPVEVTPAVEGFAEIPAPVVAPVPDQPDDLKLIVGIGPALEKKLHAHGISGYRQLATLSDEDIDQLETAIKAAGRIRRDDWIGQAKTQHFRKYGEQL